MTTITRSLSSPPYRLPARQTPTSASGLHLRSKNKRIRSVPRPPPCGATISSSFHICMYPGVPCRDTGFMRGVKPKPLDGENVCYNLRANPFRATIVNSFSHLTPFCTHRRSRHTVILSLGIITTCTLNSLLHDTPITPSSFQAISFLFSAQWRNSLN